MLIKKIELDQLVTETFETILAMGWLMGLKETHKLLLNFILTSNVGSTHPNYFWKESPD